MTLLLSLPTELQDQIISYCDTQGLKVLRLLHRSLLDTASDALFSECSTTFFPWSFDRLDALSRSSRARSVKRLTIYSAYLGDVSHWARTRRQSGDSEKFSQDYGSFTDQLQFDVPGGSCYCMGSRGLVNLVPKAEWPQAWQAYQVFRQEQATFFDGRYLEKLGETLRRLPHLESLSITQFRSEEFPHVTRHLKAVVTWTAENKSIALAQDMMTLIHSEIDNHIDAVPKLLPAVSTLGLRKLCIQQEYDVSWDLTQMQPLLDRLEELELELKVQLRRDDDIMRARNKATVALSKCPRLRSLTLRAAGRPYLCQDFAEYTTIDELLLTYTWHELR